MKRSVLKIGLLAVLCLLSASSVLASFTAINGPNWFGETDYYYGNTEITTATTYNNSGALTYNTATLPGDTGPIQPGVLRSGNFYWGMGVLVWGADGATINNNSGGTIQSIVSGTGEAQAEGILSLQSVTITNSGLIDGEVTNHDGVASGVNQSSSEITVVNNVGATISAVAPYYASGIQCANKVSIINNGTITAVSYAGTEGATANQANAYTIGTGGDNPTYVENVENNGILTAICPSTTATNTAQVYTCWNNAPNTFKNTGFMYCENDSPNGNASDFYYGVQGYDESFFNSGMITNYSVNGHGWAVLWMENDADNGNYAICNTGTLACNSSNMNVLFAGGFGPPGNNYIYYTNSGTFNGGPVTLAFPGTAWEAGQILTTSYGLTDGSQMHVTGLPTINPTINGGGSSSTLDFNLVGTLQKINGSAVSGTNFSGLGGSGSIVVSGKTYSWNNFSNGVSGSVSAAGHVPPPWQSQDIGSVGVAGGAVYGGGLLTLLASGSDIGNTSDTFHYVYQSLSNNCSLVAQVSLALNTNANAKAGVMIRDSLNANAANAFIGVMPGNRVVFQSRSSDGGGTSSNSVTGLSQSYWVKLAQSGTTLTGYYSVNGVNWTQLGSTTISSMGAANFGGLVFDNNNNSTFNTATFAGIVCTGELLVPSVPAGLTATPGMEQATLNWQAASNAAGYNIGRSTTNGGPYTTIASVTATNYTDLNLAGRTTYYYVVTAVTPGSQGANSAQVSAIPTANVPSPWAALDIGILAVAGSENFTNNVFTVTASGSDYDASYSYTVNAFDDFRFVYETNNSANCTVVARVASEQGGNQWSKAGVTIRDSLNANAANVFIGMTPSNGVVFEHRSSDGVPGNWDNNVNNPVVPCWVKLVQSGNTFTGYYSTNGSIWTQLGTTTVSMAGAEYVGMVVCANDNGTGYANNPVTTTFTAAFDNVSVPGWPPPTTPTDLSAVAASWNRVSLTWTGLAGATGYNIKRSTNSGGPYTLIATGIPATNFTDFVASVRPGYYYVASAVVGGGETGNSPEAAVSFPKLTGTIIGTAGSWNNSGNTISNVFDGNLNTFFDAPNGDGDWAGLDFGAGVTNVITQINYCPRSDAASRMVGGIFQGANNTNFTGAVTLYTITNQPATGVFTPATITNLTAFRYVSYLSPNGGYGNVAEVEFYGYQSFISTPLPPAPTGLVAAAISTNQIKLAWRTVASAASYNVKRSTTNVGPYMTIAGGVTTTNFGDTGLLVGTNYFYVVSAVNIAGESTNSSNTYSSKR